MKKAIAFIAAIILPVSVILAVLHIWVHKDWLLLPIVSIIVLCGAVFIGWAVIAISFLIYDSINHYE